MARRSPFYWVLCVPSWYSCTGSRELKKITDERDQKQNHTTRVTKANLISIRIQVIMRVSSRLQINVGLLAVPVDENAPPSPATLRYHQDNKKMYSDKLYVIFDCCIEPMVESCLLER
jgi:hypothetical protein